MSLSILASTKINYRQNGVCKHSVELNQTLVVLSVQPRDFPKLSIHGYAQNVNDNRKMATLQPSTAETNPLKRYEDLSLGCAA